MGGSKLGGEARVSCMGHFTRRLGRLRPQGRVRGWEIRSMADFWEDIVEMGLLYELVRLFALPRGGVLSQRSVWQPSVCLRRMEAKRNLWS